jgi:hypothetical protein
VIVLNHLIVLCFLVWVELLIAVLLVLAIAFSRVSCCIGSVLIAHRVAFFSLTRRKVPVSSWETLCTLRRKAQEVCDKDRPSHRVYVFAILVAF